MSTRPTTARARVPRRDPCAVATVPLSTLVRRFVDDWNRERRSVDADTLEARARHAAEARWGRPRDPAPEPAVELSAYSPVKWLVEETARLGRPVSKTTVERILRASRGLPGSSSDFTDFDVADAIVSAIDRPDAFRTGELRIVQNPMTNSCCSGSMRAA